MSLSLRKRGVEQGLAAVEGAWRWGIFSCRFGGAEALVKVGPSQLKPSVRRTVGRALQASSEHDRTTESRPESPRSVRARRLVGWVSLASLPVSVIAAALGQSTLATIAALVVLCAPSLGMIAHLNFTGCLTRADKAVWRRQLWVGHQAFVATWTYLLSRDLPSATRDLEASLP